MRKTIPPQCPEMDEMTQRVDKLVVLAASLQQKLEASRLEQQYEHLHKDDRARVADLNARLDQVTEGLVAAANVELKPMEEECADCAILKQRIADLEAASGAKSAARIDPVPVSLPADPA